MSRGMLLSLVTLLLVVATLLTSVVLMANTPRPRVRLTDLERTISVQKHIPSLEETDRRADSHR